MDVLLCVGGWDGNVCQASWEVEFSPYGDQFLLDVQGYFNWDLKIALKGVRYEQDL